MDVRHAPGFSWAQLIRFLGAEIDNPTSLIYHPMVAAPLGEGLLMSLVYAVVTTIKTTCTDRYHAAPVARSSASSMPSMPSLNARTPLPRWPRSPR
jgi:hypothetical protein